MKVLFHKNPLIILFLFLLSLSNINSEDTTIIWNQKNEFNINDVTHYILQVGNYNNYIKIEVEGKSNTKNYIVSVYSDGSRMKRIQLGQSFNGKTIVYLAPGQKVGNSIFFDLECDDYVSFCDGSIFTSDSKSIDLKEGEQLSYYVSEGNSIKFFESKFKFFHELWIS